MLIKIEDFKFTRNRKDRITHVECAIVKPKGLILEVDDWKGVVGAAAALEREWNLGWIIPLGQGLRIAEKADPGSEFTRVRVIYEVIE